MNAISCFEDNYISGWKSAPSPRRESDDVFVVLPHKMLPSLPLERYNCPARRGGGGGGGNYSIGYIFISKPSPFDSALQTQRDMKFHFWVNFPL